MAQLQEALPVYMDKETHTDQDKSVPNPEPVADTDKTNTLTFVTSDGEVIVFDGMDVPLAEATTLASEEALGKIWNRPAEDAAWRDM